MKRIHNLDVIKRALAVEPAPLDRVKPMWELQLRYIYRALKANGWARVPTAKALGVSVRMIRNTIAAIRAAGIEVPDSPSKGGGSKPGRRAPRAQVRCAECSIVFFKPRGRVNAHRKAGLTNHFCGVGCRDKYTTGGGSL